jgi:hypothetical protein
MWRVPAFLLLVPIYTAIAWGSYVGAKWLLTLLGVSGTDQVAAGAVDSGAGADCIIAKFMNSYTPLNAPEPAKRTVATGGPATQQCPVGCACGLNTFGQRAIQSRVVVGDISSECIERPPQRLPHLRRFDLLRFGFQHATKHEIGYVCKSFRGPCASPYHRFSRNLF